MLGEISSSQLSEWIAFFALEPWGCELHDGRTASLLAMIANAWGKQRRRVEQFMPDRDERNVLRGEDMMRFFMGMVPANQRPEGY